MINCTIHNYKEWIDAYVDGNLSNIDRLTAESFLQKHPQILDAYLEKLSEFSLIPDQTKMIGKDKLSIDIFATKHITLNNFTDYFINDIEGLLSHGQRLELLEFLQFNPSLKKEYQIYQSTKLVADGSITFPNEKDLLKKSRSAVSLFGPISIAASILLVVGVWLLWPTPQTNSIIAHDANYVQVTANNSHKTGKQNIIESNILAKQDDPTHDIKTSRKKLSPIHHQISERNMELAITSKTPNYQLIEIKENGTAQLDLPELNKIILPENENLAVVIPKKKGLFNKLFDGEKLYVEDYVNATFSALSNKEEEKWVLQVDRDENGQSKKVTLSSKGFNPKQKN